jgi:hypothetical protein
MVLSLLFQTSAFHTPDLIQFQSRWHQSAASAPFAESLLCTPEPAADAVRKRSHQWALRPQRDADILAHWRGIDQEWGAGDV